MLKNYIKVALRNIYKNKLFSFINIVGLGVAIAVCIVAYVNYEFANSFDSFYENGDRIYSVNHFKIVGGNRQNWAYTPTPMAKLLKAEMPGIKYLSKYTRDGGTVKYGDKVFSEGLQFVEPEFFDMLSFNFVKGNGTAIKDQRTLILDEDNALKYFGDEDPIGKQISIVVSEDKTFEFFVGAVIKNSPKNSSFQLSIILPYETLTDLKNEDHESWSDYTRALLFEVYDNSSIPEITNYMQKYLEPVNQANPDWLFDGFYLIPLKEISTNSRELYGRAFKNGMHPASILAPSVIAFLIMLLACFNFVNTSLAFSSKRLKEIGIRKVIGGLRSQVIKQFLGENIILCIMALVLGLVLAEIFVPAYQSLWPYLNLELHYADNLGLVGFLVGLLLFTAVAAGSYPAFYVSSFKPAGILKGNLKLGGTNPLIRILLTFQFVLALTAIISGLVMVKNADFISNFDVGFHKDGVIHVQLRENDRYDILKSAIEKNAEIKSIAGSRIILGWNLFFSKAKINDNEVELVRLDIGENYLQTMGINLKEGRSLNPDMETDLTGSIIVNEAFIKEYGSENGLGTVVKFNDDGIENDYRIVGIVGDVYYNSLWGKVRPMAMKLLPREQYSVLSLSADPANLEKVYESVEESWKELFPTQPFEGVYESEVLAEAGDVNESIKLVFIYVAMIAIIISCMGLFALVALNIAKRTKEIGIRKILGASLLNIGKIISKEFLLILSISSVLGAGFGYYMAKMMLASVWVYYVSIGADIFILSTVLIFTMAILTVSSQVISISTSNPVNSLRDE